MSSSTIFNKAEIMLYSTLTSVLSGINHLIYHEQPISPPQEKSSFQGIVDEGHLDLGATKRSFSISWESFQQAFLSLLLWVILGLAAGFLIGMIRGG